MSSWDQQPEGWARRCSAAWAGAAESRQILGRRITGERPVAVAAEAPLRASAGEIAVPAGVVLRPGVLTVAFESEEQLLERLFCWPSCPCRLECRFRLVPAGGDRSGCG